MVGQVLSRLHPAVAVEYRWIDAEGDRLADQPLSEHGGKGLFTGTLERALLAGEADLAVHSLKDLPARDTPGLVIAAVLHRADVRDCLISRDGADSLRALPAGAVVGTSSPRRAAQVLRLRPDLRVEPIRGNVDTRIRKVLEAEGGAARYDAALLAVAGLQRLGRAELAERVIPLEEVLPANGQGALAVQCRADDHVTLTRCLPLNDPVASTAVHAERQVVAALGCDCHSPIAVLCEPADLPASGARSKAAQDGYRLRVRVLSRDGQRCLEVDETARARDLRRLVKQVVQDLVRQGAPQLLAESRRLRPASAAGLGAARSIAAPRSM